MAGASAATATGLVLGRYRPLRPLGSGGMGSVWHARDEQQGRDVALKIVSRTGTAGPRAEREAAAAAELHHPACLRVYALGRDEGHVYIAYEYVPGRTLRQALEQRELDDRDATEAAAQILEGLAHAHERGIVHRDVKPSNVLLADGPNVSVRLLDFGLALVTEEETLTAVGDVPGTLAYISPERLKGRTAGPETDVWSVGVLLWEALAGRHPFGAGPFMEVAKRIERGAPSLATVRSGLPKPLVQLVDRALAVDPARRPPARKLASALRRSYAPRNEQASLPRHVAAVRLAGRLLPALPAALLAAWSSATFSFFPAHWPAGLAAVAALLTLVAPRGGLAFALAVPVLPLGNLSLGLAVCYTLFALAWLALFWSRPRSALIFVCGPLLGPLGALGLVPLAVLPAGRAFRRALQAGAALLAAAVVAGTSGSPVPLVGGHAPGLGVEGLTAPQATAAALWRGLQTTPGLALETVVLAAAAAALGAVRARGPWAAAAYGTAVLSATLLAAPAAAAVPLVAAAWISAVLLAIEPERVRSPASIARLTRRILPIRRALSAAAGS